MILVPPVSKLTDTLLPYTTLFRSLHLFTDQLGDDLGVGLAGEDAAARDQRVAKGFEIFDDAIVDDGNLIRGMGMGVVRGRAAMRRRSEEHTSELQSLMRISYAVFCLKKKKYTTHIHNCDNTDDRKV